MSLTMDRARETALGNEGEGVWQALDLDINVRNMGAIGDGTADDTGAPDVGDLPLHQSDGTAAAPQRPEDRRPGAETDGPEPEVGPRRPDVPPPHGVGQTAEKDQSQAVPHPQQSPVLKDSGVMCFA